MSYFTIMHVQLSALIVSKVIHIEDLIAFFSFLMNPKFAITIILCQACLIYEAWLSLASFSH